MVYFCIFAFPAFFTKTLCQGSIADPYKEWNLTPVGFNRCVNLLLEQHLPTLLLGGGGYNHTHAAKHWAQLTSLSIWHSIKATATNVYPDTFESWLQQEQLRDVPEQDEHWAEYGPDYVLGVTPGNRLDDNTDPSFLSGMFHFFDSFATKLQQIYSTRKGV
jgi:hypothetical protein